MDKRIIAVDAIPSWVLRQNEINVNYFDLDATIEKETEKAYLVKLTGKSGNRTFWVAKSVMQAREKEVYEACELQFKNPKGEVLNVVEISKSYAKTNDGREFALSFLTKI